METGSASVTRLRGGDNNVVPQRTPPVNYDESVYDNLFGPGTLEPVSSSSTTTTTTVPGGIGGVL